MKKITTKSIILFCVSLLALTACDFLELESPNDLDAGTYFTKPEHAENALIGLYSTMQSPSYYGGNYLLVSEPLAGNSITGGFDNINVDEFGFQAVTATNIIVEDMWFSIYNVVANTNRLIEGLSNIPGMDATRKDEIEGQARFIRALAHFDLLRYFGEHWDASSQYGIPVVENVQKLGDVQPRATVAGSYNFIITELENALTLVNQDDRDQAFVNASTVRALLARVYFYNKEYAEAIEQATAVINDGAYSLLASGEYGTIFSNRQTTESIFELAFDSQNRSRYNGLTYSRPEATNTEVNFIAADTLSGFFEDAERAGDVRSALVDFNPSNNDLTIAGRTQKYRGEATEDNPAYVIRLAEMYLILAEAKGRVEGLDDLNTLRTQRGLAALLPGDVADDLAYQVLLLQEIRAEFNFEGHLYFNYARMEKIEPGGLLDLESFRAILPIPLREITTTNEVVSQNPGY
jgi:starch-binding outer membrane protein, SusD/RagB family